MEIFLSYVLKVNIALVLFYLLYKVLFQKDTFFQARRCYLLGAVFFAFVYPFLPIDALGEFLQLKQSAATGAATVSFGNLSQGMVVADEGAASLDWKKAIMILYAAVTSYFLLRFSWHLIRILKVRMQSEARSFNNISYRYLNDELAPFSFFKWIFIEPESHSDEKLKQILIHEQIHVQQWHSLDVMLMEIVRLLFWWNPFVWLMKKEIVINLEYIADNGVLEKGIDRRNYQYHLLHLAYSRKNILLTNNFNISKLKQRVMMMNSEKTPMRKLAKYLLVLPVVLLLIAANSAYAQQTKPEKVEEKKGKLVIRGLQDSISGKPLIVIDGAKMAKDFNMSEIKPDEIESISILKNQSATSQYGEDGKDGVIIISKKKNGDKNGKENSAEPKEEIFVVVEDQPEFPGGNAAMMEFLSNNINYPAEAKEKGIQGRVIVNYVVEKDGSISEVHIVRGVDPMLDKEAVRVIESMPDWKPGKQRGKEVRVRYTLPIVFRLPVEGQVQDEVVIHYKEDKANATDSKIVPNPPTPAKFPGGDEAMFKYMAESVKYPVIAMESGIQGLVEVVYNIDKDGKASFVRFNKNTDPSLDKEARRVLESMPKWRPGQVDGKPANMTFTQSFLFRLQGDNVKPYSGETPDNAVVIVGYSSKH